jgi:ribonuclease P protein component
LDDRLRSPGDFRRVFREGKAVSTPDVIIHTAKSPDNGPGRYGLVVSRKVGGAVVRNRLRRQIRAAIALAGGIPSGLDTVVVVKPGASVRVAELSQRIWQIMEDSNRNQASVPEGGR